MPNYQYQCSYCTTVVERYESLDTSVITCPACGELAQRAPFYRDQYIQCETGPRGGLKNEPPRDEKDLRQPFRQYQEASQEIEYAYNSAEQKSGETLKRPDYYKEGVRQAKKRGAKIRT